MKKDPSIKRYIGRIPEILRYQILTKLLLGICAFGIRWLRSGVLWTSSRSALSSGDISFMMSSWQGWVVILLGVALLALYMIFDVNAMIVLSKHIIYDEEIRVRNIVREAFESVKYFKSFFGIIILFHVAFLLPIAGVGLGITLTDHFYIPNFITEVIEANTLYNVLYTLVLMLIYVISVIHIFTFHEVMLRGTSAIEGVRQSRRIMRKHWRNVIRRYVRFAIRSFLFGVMLVVLVGIVLLGIEAIVPYEGIVAYRAMITFFSFTILFVAQLYGWLFIPFQYIQLTRIYLSYQDDKLDELSYRKRPFKIRWLVYCTTFWLLIAGISVGSAFAFDELFPPIGNTAIVAHRAGGSLGNENTVYGLNLAIEANVEASEIDVQRTKDGVYILQHDDTFQRLTGDTRTVSEMTYDEISTLSVPDYYNLGGADQPFATLEEILDTSKGRIHLYVELKGTTADVQMIDDLYQIVYEKDMLQEVTFISLNYPLISSMEDQYPDANTGYLCYAAVGRIEDLDVDELILEEETATSANIDTIHAAGKKVLVWTVNEPIVMARYLSRGVDGMITDEVEMSIFVKELVNIEIDGEYAQAFEDVKRVILQTIFVWWS